MNLKNTLAENMLRFGPKNLSESDRRNLQRLMEDKKVAYAENIRALASYKNATSGNPDVMNVDNSENKYIYIGTGGDLAPENDYGTIKRAFETGRLIVERNFIGDYSIAAGITGTITRSSGKFTAGTALKIYTFTGEPIELEEEDDLVNNITTYNGSTKNGSVNAATIAVAATTLGQIKLVDLWPKLTKFVNAMAEIQLCPAITDENKNAVYQQYVANGGKSAAGSSF